MDEQLRHSFTTIDGVRLHSAELGTPSLAPPIVLLHGVTDSHLTWRAVAAELARDRLVLMPDLPGCGLSERPDASYTLNWHAQIIGRWLEQLGLNSIDLVGHSFGGGVAQMLLLVCPERIRRMVLVASGGLGQDVGFWLKLAALPGVVELFGQPFMAFGTRRALGRIGDRAEQDIAALCAMNAERGTARAFARTVRDVIDWRRGQTRHFLQRAHEVSKLPPIAVLWGERDTLIPVAHGKAFADSIDGVVFRSFSGCGHYLHMERSTDFAGAVRQFFEDPSAQPARLRPLQRTERASASFAQRGLKALVASFERHTPSPELP